MKKVVLCAAVGLVSLAACQHQAGYTVKGTAEGVADGEMVYLQDMVGGMLLPADSAEVKNGMFEFTCTPDSVIKARYVTYVTDDSRMVATFFSEDGTVNVALNPEGSTIYVPQNQVSIVVGITIFWDFGEIDWTVPCRTPRECVD